jgi:hypothetical protein
MEILKAILLSVGLIIGVIILTSIICAVPTMLLWNWLMPTIFGLTKISFWQAFGLDLLCGILFKSSNNNNNNSN